MNPYEPPEPSNHPANMADRELVGLENHKGREIAIYESESEHWHGAVVAHKGESAECAEYESDWDEDAGVVTYMINHILIEREPGMSYEDVLQAAIKYIDMHEGGA